jgi:hypothetical protein
VLAQIRQTLGRVQGGQRVVALVGRVGTGENAADQYLEPRRGGAAGRMEADHVLMVGAMRPARVSVS